MNKRLLYGGLIVLLAAGLIAAFFVEKPGQYEFPYPEEIVQQYFESWSEGDYPNMYATISDGFKRIEPTAMSFQAFKDYVGAQGVDEIIINNIETQSNDGSTAIVSYDVLLMVNGSEVPLSGDFTLRNRQGDIIRGWKIINPHGEKADMS